MIRDSDIKDFVSKMTYWERVNTYMSEYLLENPYSSREEAYKDFMDSGVDDSNAIEYRLEKIIRFGSSVR
ncbi:hypothetical protein LacP0734_14810 [Lacticaseibacillus paracasei subsp. tolerans]|uniref:hypothetical protein n=1 Tax=Lacticaseibacillus paracasei TaxID=1597 RepID=UPI001892B36B|nr:hypothetical protein [Lacticaseibacillus paracasei]QPC18874.1 hypothetical protein LacP0734_14810 [Lacticaseibacillus paracasei subsp. tolerans]